MKKENKIFGIFLFAIVAVLATMAGALATTTYSQANFTVILERPNASYSNDNAIVVQFMPTISDLDVGSSRFNASNASIFTNADGTWKNNATFASATASNNNNTINGTLINFTMMPTADRTFSFQVVVWNQSGTRIYTSQNYTITYDGTNPTLSIDVPVFNPATKITTATYSTSDATAVSNCTMPSGSVVSATAGVATTDTTTETTSGNSKTYTITCNDKAGNSVSASSTYDAVWGSVIGMAGNYQQVTSTKGGVTTQKLVKITSINPIYIIFGAMGLGLMLVLILVFALAMKKGKKRR